MRRIPIVIAVLMVIGCPTWAAKTAESGELSSVTTIIEGKIKHVMHGKMFWQGTSYRSEVRRGPETMIVLRGPSGDTYMYLPSRKAATRMPRQKGEELGTIPSVMADEIKDIVKKSRKIGSGKISGFQCDIYEHKEKMGPHMVTGKRWVSKDPRFPMIMKSVSTLQGGSRTWEITSVKLGGRYPASLFTLPKGTKVTTVPVSPHKGMNAPRSGTGKSRSAPPKSQNPSGK